MTLLPATVPGGLVTALHVALRTHARKKEGAWYGLSRFLPTLTQSTQGNLHQALQQALERLHQESPREAELLKSRYWQGTSVDALALQWNVAPSTVYTWQRRAIRALARCLWLLEQEERERLQNALAFKMRHLPAATYSRLFGVETWMKQLETWLLEPQGPHIVFIEGLGGLGKTSLAHAFAYQHLHHWDDVAWLCSYAHQPTWEDVHRPLDAEALMERLAWQMGWSQISILPPSQRMVELRIRLARRRYLVVWDDLLPSTIAQITTLLPPPPSETRFLITTRYRYPHYEGAHIPLKELSREHALALLRHEVQQRGLPSLPNRLLHSVYDHLGGNPLALKLAVAHLTFLPAEKVLGHLRGLPQVVEEGLFTHVYRPLVERLPDHAFLVLQAMPFFAPQGATYQDLQEATQLPHAVLDEALYRLVYVGLLDFDPRPPPRYHIHRLTYVYLTQNHHPKSNHNSGRP